MLKDDAVLVLHPICQQIRKTRQWPQNRKRSVFIPIPKKCNAKECSKKVKSLSRVWLFLTQWIVAYQVPPFMGFLQERILKSVATNYCSVVLISHASKVMLKILQARLQKYVNWEIPDVQPGFRKGKGTKDKIVNIRWIIEKAREFQKKYLLLLHWLC